MKRLFLLLAVIGGLMLVTVGVMADTATDTGATPLSASLSPVVTWSVQNWIVLYIPNSDMSVDLGTINGSLYDPTTDTWTPLTSKAKNAYVISNTNYTLTLHAASTGTNTADLSRFEVKGGALSAFTPLASDQTLKTGGAGLTHISDIQYEYIPSWDDAPGAYAVTVTYTLTSP